MNGLQILDMETQLACDRLEVVAGLVVKEPMKSLMILEGAETGGLIVGGSTAKLVSDDDEAREFVAQKLEAAAAFLRNTEEAKLASAVQASIEKQKHDEQGGKAH